MDDLLSSKSCVCLWEMENKLPPSRHCFMPCVAQHSILAKRKVAVELLSEVIEAWEALPEGHHEADTISEWLQDDMHPVINKYRTIITKYKEK